jgi:hypothetical protein
MHTKHLLCSAALTAAALGLLTAPMALAQKKVLTEKDTHYSVYGASDDGLGLRAGYEGTAAGSVGPLASAGAAAAALAVMRSEPDSERSWKSVGPVVGTVPGPVTYTGAASSVSGRVTSLLVAPDCRGGDHDCTVYVGSAGGGVWRSDDALSSTPHWRSVSRGLPTISMGTLALARDGDRGATLYAGTGEPNGSSDSEAGLGLYRSDDGGESWRLVPGSASVAYGRSIGGIAVDPRDSQHILIGTAVARRGASSSNGGRFTPPGAPQIGLYESRDGGEHFSLAFSLPSDAVDPTSANGSDFFRGGITKIAATRLGLHEDDPTRFYFAVEDYGVYRSTPSGGYEQVFASAGGGSVAGSVASRTEFALAPMGKKLRIYVVDADVNGIGSMYRTDDANLASPVWITLTSSVPGTPGFSSYAFCGTQCSYDMFVASPDGQPDTVWIGGSMIYGEIFFPGPFPSNGRAVQRSTNAGVSFTDMTNDATAPLPIGMHPDQHAIAFVPSNPGVAIIGSDGGVVRTDGSFVDASGQCADPARGFAHAGGLAPADLADCQLWLKAIPHQILPMNPGIASLQFEHVSVNPLDPANDLLGGTQDNGTWAYDGRTGKWFETVGGDGGQSAINAIVPKIRIHTYYLAQLDVNFNGGGTDPVNEPLGWDWVSDALLGSGEASSFYVPLIADPVLNGTFFVGLEHVWRTQDNAGSQADLDLNCNEYFGLFPANHTCGDWVPLGAAKLTSTSYGADKGGSGSYVVAIQRAPAAGTPLWVGTRRGRLFLSTNADAADPTTVAFTRIDTAAQPIRFISGIAVDPKNPWHAFVSFAGYDAYTPTTTGHVFEVTYDPGSHTAKWVDRSVNIGDQPVTGVAYDSASGRVYAATDFGVIVRKPDSGQWVPVASGLPPVAVYGITLDAKSGLLYAATHGRGIWSVRLHRDD